MDGIVLSAIGLILAVAVLIFLAFNNFHNAYVAVGSVIVLAVFSQLPIWDTIANGMLGGFANYMKGYYLLFLAGAVLGRIYQLTGAAVTIADAMLNLFGVRNAILAIMLFGYVAIMGGIQSFVAFFAVYPVALRVFQRADINIAILPAVMGGGMWTIGHVSPWAPSVANQVASNALGTTGGAGWLPGIIYTVVAGALIVLYSNQAAKKLRANGKGFTSQAELLSLEDSARPSLIPALIPLLGVFVLYNVAHLNVSIATWAGVALSIHLFWKYIGKAEWKDALTEGAKSGTVVAVNTALVVSVGSVIAVTPFYDWMMGWVARANMNPYILAVVVTGILALITASASGAITILFDLLGPTFVEYGAMGYNLEFIHRLAVQSVSCWDSLPHCGPLIGLFTVCKVSHKEAYKHVFATTIVIPIIACYLVELPFCMIFG